MNESEEDEQQQLKATESNNCNNVSTNQFNHQQTSTLLNHHDHTQLQNANDSLQHRKGQHTGTEATAAAPAEVTATKLTQFRTMAMHNFGPNSLHQQQDQHQIKQHNQAADSSWQDNQNSSSSGSISSGNNSNNNNNNNFNTNTTNNNINNLIDTQSQIGSHFDRNGPTSPSNVTATSSALNDCQQQMQSQQHYGLYNQQVPSNLQSSLASRVEQIIRNTLNDSPANVPKSISSNHISNKQTMPQSASPMIFNPATSLSPAQNPNTSSASSIGLMSTNNPSLNQFYANNMNTADPMNNNNSGNNLSARISAHAASNSALAAAAALQSLNQSHIQRSHQSTQQIPFTASSRPSSNPMVPQAAHGSNIHVPKLGITSTTSSDHQNHNHLALSGNHLDSTAEISARVQANMNNSCNTNNNKIPFLNSARTGWQEPSGGASLPPPPLSGNLGNNSRLQSIYGMNPSSIPASFSNSLSPFNTMGNTSLPSGLNSSNSNTMIGLDGDNLMRSNKNDRNPMGNPSFGASSLQDHDERGGVLSGSNNQLGPGGNLTNLNNQAKQNYQWLDNFKGPSSLSDASGRLQAQQRASDEMERNSEKLTAFAFNLMSTCIPGTNKTKKIIQLDDELRTSIYTGEFYTKYEHLAIGILTNQIMIPNFSIIDYIRQEKGPQETQKAENLHRRLGVSNFLCLIEAAQQRPYFHPTMKFPFSESIKIPQMSEGSQNLNIGTGISNQQQQNFAMAQNHPASKNNPNFLQPLPARSDPGLLSVDKSRRSSQSPSDINSRSHMNSNSSSKLPNAHSASNYHGPPLAQSNILSNNNHHLQHSNVISSNNNGQRNHNQHPSQALRSSPFQSPMSIGPNPMTRPPRSHSTIGSLGIGSLDLPFSLNTPQIRQPPAAHQNSSRPNFGGMSEIMHAHASSVPMTAHMASKSSHIGKQHDHASNADKVSPICTPFSSGPYTGKMGRNYVPGSPSLNNNDLPSPVGRADFDSIGGPSTQTLMSFRQQEANNRDIAMRRSLTPNFAHSGNNEMQPGLGTSHNININCNNPSELHPNSRPPQNNPSLQSIYNSYPTGIGASGNINNNGLMIRGPSGQINPNAMLNSSMPPPSMDYNKNFGDSNRLPAHASNDQLVGSEAHQYSAMVAAYNRSAMACKSPNANSVMITSFDQAQVGSNNSSLNSSDPMYLDVSQHNNSAVRPQGQQASPKQSSQRSIITGAASTGSKRSKKAKSSPTSNPGESKLKGPNADSISPAGASQQVENPVINNVENVIISQNILLPRTPPCMDEKVVMPSESESLIPDGIKAENDASNLVGNVDQESAPINRQSNDDMKMSNSAPDHVHTTAVSTNLSTETFARGSAIYDAQSVSKRSDTTVEKHEDHSKIIPSDSTLKSEKEYNIESGPPPKSDTLETASLKNLQVNTDDSNSVPAQASKYQKIFTKKAWLKNYDLEDQTRGTEELVMPVKLESVEIKNDELIASEPKKEDVKPVGGKLACTKGSKTAKVDNKKKSKDSKSKKIGVLSSVRNSRATSKGPEHDSEETNASTSELDDTDETDSMKSTNEKKLRRMPKRKVKLNSDKESDQQNSPLSNKSNKDSSRKRGKKEKVIGAVEAVKRNFNSDDEEAAKQKSKKIKETTEKIPEPAQKIKKRVGEKFLQTDACYDIVPKSARCLECRRVRQSSLKGDKNVSSKQSRTNWDDFCRFYQFRKLRYNKSAQIVVAGFSDGSDARDSDKRLWLPNGSEVPAITYPVAKFILANVGDEFCNLVMQERAVLKAYETNHDNKNKITWKRVVNGLRELCDVCSTTLFNCHFVCERCGFVVCIDCHQSRAQSKSIDLHEDASIEKELSEKSSISVPKTLQSSSDNGQQETTEQAINNSSKRSKKDSHGWIYCAKNEEHSNDKLILTQIIAGNCLEEVWKLLHDTRDRLKLGYCKCRNSHDDESVVTDEKGSNLKGRKNLGRNNQDANQETSDPESEGSHSTLKGLLLATGSQFGNNSSTTNDISDTVKLDGNSDQGAKSTETLRNPPLVDAKFDFGNEDDSQDDSRQVSAAIEECIASLASKGHEESHGAGVVPNFAGFVSPSIVDQSTHSKLCDGDLLVLSHAKHPNNIGLFREHWRLGKPVLVRGVHKLMNIDYWKPQLFAVEFGDYRSDLVDCRNGDIHRHSMKKYWDGFEPNPNTSKRKQKDDFLPSHIPPANNEEPSAISTTYYTGSALWRLKDWPPGQDFNEILPAHYQDFMDNLPLKSYTTRTGKMNLACRLPREMLKPDLGPKMYSAYGTSRFPERGTTNLHLDISDAINVMVYVSGAAPHSSGSTEYREMYDKTIEECIVDPAMKSQIRQQNLIPGALWHIFEPSDTPKMREFLNKVSDERKLSPDRRNDPIHDQIWYLDQTLLDRLEAEYGVKSYSILQCMGDAIIIPAGAPHQVKNVQNCIKVANDFVSPENVHHCLQLTNEFRNLPETHINQEDKLQVKNILYHSVKESLQYIKMFEAGEVDVTEESDDEDLCDDSTEKMVSE